MAIGDWPETVKVISCWREEVWTRFRVRRLIAAAFELPFSELRKSAA